MQVLTHEMQHRQEWLYKQGFETELGWWNKLSEFERLYLRVRACDIAHFGAAVANQTWPQPTIAGVAAARVSHLVSLLVELETDVVKEIRDKRIIPQLYNLSGDIDEMPGNLAPRVLNENERETAKKACLDGLFQSGEDKGGVPGMLMFIHEFARFCDLLSKPENHIKRQTGQYVEKEVPLRTEADMANEMIRELTSLPNHTAYAKITQTEYGNQRVAKIKTLELPEKWSADIVNNVIKQDILYQTYLYYCQKREIIEREIRARQSAWQKDLSEKPIPDRQVDIKPERHVKNEEASLPLPTRQQ